MATDSLKNAKVLKINHPNVLLDTSKEGAIMSRSFADFHLSTKCDNQEENL
jgi:hypothetical protein